MGSADSLPCLNNLIGGNTMGRKRLDLSERNYGMLTVLKYSHSNKNRASCWLCKCECGNEIIVCGNNLVRGHTTSCGCKLPWNKGKKCPQTSGSKNGNWKGGKRLDKRGYVRVSGFGCRYHEHRIVAEKVLGRPLKRWEVVHHINGDKADNRNCNLLICTRSYHKQLHERMAQLYQQEHFQRRQHDR